MPRIHLRRDLACNHRLNTPTPLPPAPSSPGRPALWTLIGLTLASCTIVAALVLQLSYDDGEAKLIVARWVPQPVSAPTLPPENLPSAAQPAPSTFQVAAAEPRQRRQHHRKQHRRKQPSWLRPHRKAPRRQHSSASRSHAVAANDRARSPESGAKHRTAQGEPAANSQRQFKGHCGAQGEPGRDETRAREGFRAEPAQSVTAFDTHPRRRPCASASGRLSGHTRERGLDTKGSGCTTIGSPRCAHHRNPILQQH